MLISVAIQYSTSVRRQFVEMAFARVGMPIRWQGPRGVEETGIVAGGSQAGKTVVMISPQFFRPVEVMSCVALLQKSCPCLLSGTWCHWRGDGIVQQLYQQYIAQLADEVPV